MTVRDPSVDAFDRIPRADDVPCDRRTSAGTPAETSGSWGRIPGVRASEMSLRDHFAGLALQGMMANNPLFANPEVAYQKADEMMKVRQL